jgi:hypothetical protein
MKEDYEPRTELFGSFEPRNELLTWEDCIFQGPKQVTWEQASGPNFEIRNNPVSWQWKKIKVEPDFYELYTQNTSWNETKSTALFPRTWKQIKNFKCTSSKDDVGCLELVPSLSSSTFTQTLTSTIRVLEIPPTVYLDIIHSKNINERESPYTVTLSPRFIRSGSFPIEIILWDLGDGTPVIERNRNTPLQSYSDNIKFVYQGAFSNDFLDPRNYDLIYTYTRTSNTNNCFYPSITAIASSTGTSSCAKNIVGPLKYISATKTPFKLNQNYLGDTGVAYSGIVNDTAVFWNRNK